MIKNIIVQPSDNVSFITEYFDFTGIPYQIFDLWSNDNDEFGGYQIPHNLESSVDNLLVLDHSILYLLLNQVSSREQLNRFVKNNQIWAWNNLDGAVLIKNYADHIPSNNITVFVDCIFTSPPQHLNIQTFPVNNFLKMPRIISGVSDKINCKYDFLLTTILSAARPHRTILLKDLESRSIYAQGLISKNSIENKVSGWIGDKPRLPGCGNEEYPSMDLYRQCWFEIAPETLHQDGYFYTDKTNKPIATKTPFLTVSTKGYLEYIRSLGFKTFDSLINESYDQQDSIEDRVRLMLDQAEDIIANGSEQFYHAAMPILEHNYNHLAEISGKWDHLMDAFITQQLERIGFRL